MLHGKSSYRQLHFYGADRQIRSLRCQFPNFCCACGAIAYPLFLSGNQFPQDSGDFFNNFFALVVCPACGTGLVLTYRISSPETASLVDYAPLKPQERTFDPSISDISGRFVKIYNQALAAETLGYDEIAGMGYRKALEILIKDFLIKQNPANAESIISEPLSQIISNEIQSPKLQAMASRAAWLGNDHVHYYQKHTDKDLEDLKHLIDGILSYINIDIVTAEALQIDRK